MRKKLAFFESEVRYNVAFGIAGDDLDIVDSDGYTPVVACLEEEPLRLMLARVRAVGGSANVFIKRAGGVCLITSRCVSDRKDGVEDLSDKREWASGEASISTFLDYLDLCSGKAMYLPDQFEKPTGSQISVSDSSVDMEQVPVKEPVVAGAMA